MKIKQLEIRDRATFIPALAIQVSGDDGYLMRRAGFGDDPMIYLIQLESEQCHYDPYSWAGRTMPVAHQYIAEHWDNLQDGAVVDVEFILGETRRQSRSRVSARRCLYDRFMNMIMGV